MLRVIGKISAALLICMISMGVLFAIGLELAHPLVIRVGYIGLGIAAAVLIFRSPDLPVVKERWLTGPLAVALLLSGTMLFPKKTDTQIAELRSEDIGAYLSYLESWGSNDAWLAELRELRPEEFEAELQRREAVERERQQEAEETRLAEQRREAERQARREAVTAARIELLVTEAREIAYMDFEENLRIYRELSRLEPENAEFQRREELYENRLRLADDLDDTFKNNYVVYEWNIAANSGFHEDLITASSRYDLVSLDQESATLVTHYNVRRRDMAQNPEVTVRYQFNIIDGRWHMCRWRAPDENNSPWVGAC